MIQGDLTLVQREVLKAYNKHDAYNTPIITDDISLEVRTNTTFSDMRVYGLRYLIYVLVFKSVFLKGVTG